MHTPHMKWQTVAAAARRVWGLCSGLPSVVKREMPTTWGTLRMQQMKVAQRLRPVTWPVKRALRERVIVPSLDFGTRATKRVASFIETRPWKAREEFKKKGVKVAFDQVAPKGEPLLPYKRTVLKKPLTFAPPPAPAPTADPAATHTVPADRKAAAARTMVQRHTTTTHAPKPAHAPTKRK